MQLYKPEKNDFLIKPQQQFDNLTAEIKDYFYYYKLQAEEKKTQLLKGNLNQRQSLNIDEQQLLNEINQNGKPMSNEKLQKLIRSSLKKLTGNSESIKNEVFDQYLLIYQEMNQKCRNLGDKIEEQYLSIDEYTCNLIGQKDREIEEITKLSNWQKDIQEQNGKIQQELQNLSQKMQEKQKNISDKEKQIQSFQQTINDFQIDNDQLTKSIKDVNEFYLEANQKEKKIVDQISIFEREINNAKQMKDEKNLMYFNINQQIEGYQLEINKIQFQIDNLNEESRNNQIKNAFIDNTHRMKGGIITQISDLRHVKDYQNLQNEMNELIQERDNIIAKKYNEQRKIDELVEEIDKNNQNLQAKNQSLNHLSNLNQLNQEKRTEMLKEQFQHKKKKIELQEQITDYQNEINDWRSYHSLFERQLRRYQSNEQSWKSELIENQKKEEKLQNDINLKIEAIEYLEKQQLPEEKLKYFSQIEKGIQYISQSINKLQKQLNETNQDKIVIEQRAKAILKQLGEEEEEIDTFIISKVVKLLQDAQQILINTNKQIEYGSVNTSQPSLQIGNC